MGPTVHDVRGAPVPGVAGMAPRPVPVPARQRFQQLLQQLRPPASGGRRFVPTPPALRFHSGAGIPLRRQPPAVRFAPGSPAPPRAAQGKHALAASIRHAAAHAGVEPALSVAIARAESSLDPGARSPDGRSVGTFQVTHTTAAEMRHKIATGRVVRPPGSDDVALGVGYLRYLQDLFARDARLGHGLETVAVADADERRRFAIAAYNAGEGRVARAQAQVAAAGGDPTRFADVRPYLPHITRGYVERVVAFAGEEARSTAVV